MVGAELDAELAHPAPDLLVEPLDLVGDELPGQDAEPLGDLKGDAAGRAVEFGGVAQHHQRLERGVDGVAKPQRQAVLDALEMRAGQRLVGEQYGARRHQLVALGEFGDNAAAPAHEAVGGQDHLVVGGVGEALGPAQNLGSDGGTGGGGQIAAGVLIVGPGERKPEAFDDADELAAQRDFALVVDFRLAHRPLPEVAHEQRGPPVDEALGKPLMQRVRQPVLDIARRLAPVLRILEPVPAVRDKRPGPDLLDPVGQGIDVSGDIVAEADLLGNPVIGKGAAALQVSEHRGHDLPVQGGGEFAVVGDLAAFPGQPHGFIAGRQRGVVVAHQIAERQLVGHRRHPGQRRVLGRHIEARRQRLERCEIEGAGSPLQGSDRLELVRFELFDGLLVPLLKPGGGPEGAVGGMAAGAAGDLADFGGGEGAPLMAVELLVGGEGDVIDRQVQPHADGIGGDQEIDVTAFEKLHLGVAGARAQSPHHHRRAAALAADQFGDGVDLVGGKRDDGGAARLPGELLRPGVGELGKARPGDDLGARQQATDHRPHGAGAQQQRLVAAAGVEHPVGEHMPAVGVGGDLDLVDRQALHRQLGRHGLDGRHPVAGPGGHDALLAGDQRHLVGAGPPRHSLIDLARQQPERQPDQPRSMGEQPLDRVVGLAGVGGAQDGLQVRGFGGVHGTGGAKACQCGTLSRLGGGVNLPLIRSANKLGPNRRSADSQPAPRSASCGAPAAGTQVDPESPRNPAVARRNPFTFVAIG